MILESVFGNEIAESIKQYETLDYKLNKMRFVIARELPQATKHFDGEIEPKGIKGYVYRTNPVMMTQDINEAMIFEGYKSVIDFEEENGEKLMFMYPYKLIAKRVGLTIEESD